ncbi:MAG: hypothetical protein RRY40_03500 [Oscillospiraceae bacterium]
MNCNPFTLGHKYLIESASAASDKVIVLVVEEDVSEFPFLDRIELVRRGTAHLSNVLVISGGRYAISKLTFPSYFTHEDKLAHAQAAIDADIFARHTAPALGIKKRFVGTEPLSPTTAIYNEALHSRLSKDKIEVVELSRASHQGQPISASHVRQLLHSGCLSEVKALVPAVTWDYLNSAKASEILKKLKERG